MRVPASDAAAASRGAPERAEPDVTRISPTPLAALVGFVMIAASGVAAAGPPYLTDDPEPTETGHWEDYAPAGQASGQGAEANGSVFVELNYGAAPNVQLTLDLPVAFSRDPSGSRVGAGDIAFSAKYRFYHDEGRGVSVAVFPGLSLPTAGEGLGAGRVTAFLPVWAQRDVGPWSVFGGGGYAINPGTGNRNYWRGGVAVARMFGKDLQLGAEADRQGSDTVVGRASTSLGLGGVWQLRAPFRLLVSGGPTFVDGGGSVGFHAYAAVGLNF